MGIDNNKFDNKFTIRNTNDVSQQWVKNSVTQVPFGLSVPMLLRNRGKPYSANLGTPDINLNEIINVFTPQNHDTTYSPVVLYQGDGDTTDSSGNSAPNLEAIFGTLQYADDIFISGKKCFYFDGATGLRTTSAHSPLRNVADVTIAFLGKLESNGTPATVGASFDVIWQIFRTVGANPGMGWHNSSDSFESFINGENIDTEPHHFVYKREDNVVTIYIDGVQLGESSSVLSAPGDNSNARFYLGQAEDGSSRINGYIQTVAVYNSALTDEQISNLAARTGYYA